MKKKKQSTDFDFEKSIDRLAQIVRELESGEIPLNKAIEMYEEGIEASRLCIERLNEVELRLKKITSEVNGNI